nr:hypothetical protein [Tanacetum cinerariifolium]
MDSDIVDFPKLVVVVRDGDDDYKKMVAAMVTRVVIRGVHDSCRVYDVGGDESAVMAAVEGWPRVWPGKGGRRRNF